MQHALSLLLVIATNHRFEVWARAEGMKERSRSSAPPRYFFLMDLLRALFRSQNLRHPEDP